MKKKGIFAVILALSLLLTGCMTGGMIPPPETMADGTPWNTEWVNMAGRVGVERPEGFDLLTTNGTLEDMTIHYATWKMRTNNVALQGVINKGLELMSSASVTEVQYDNWLNYSRTILSMISRNPSIMANYLSVILTANNPNLRIYQRISICLRYLIGIQNLI